MLVSSAQEVSGLKAKLEAPIQSKRFAARMKFVPCPPTPTDDRWPIRFYTLIFSSNSDIMHSASLLPPDPNAW